MCRLWEALQREYSRILDLVGKYAVSRPDVAFSCKKQVGQSFLLPYTRAVSLQFMVTRDPRLNQCCDLMQGERRADLHTTPRASRRDNVRCAKHAGRKSVADQPKRAGPEP